MALSILAPKRQLNVDLAWRDNEGFVVVFLVLARHFPRLHFGPRDQKRIGYVDDSEAYGVGTQHPQLMRILYSTYFWILYSRIQVFRRSNHVGQCLSTPFCKDRIYLNRMSLNTTKTNSISTFNITILHVEKRSSSWKCIGPNWLPVDFAKFLNVVLLDNGLSWEHHISPLLLSLIVLKTLS